MGVPKDQDDSGHVLGHWFATLSKVQAPAGLRIAVTFLWEEALRTEGGNCEAGGAKRFSPQSKEGWEFRVYPTGVDGRGKPAMLITDGRGARSWEFTQRMFGSRPSHFSPLRTGSILILPRGSPDKPKGGPLGAHRARVTLASSFLCNQAPIGIRKEVKTMCAAPVTPAIKRSNYCSKRGSAFLELPDANIR